MLKVPVEPDGPVDEPQADATRQVAARARARGQRIVIIPPPFSERNTQTTQAVPRNTFQRNSLRERLRGAFLAGAR